MKDADQAFVQGYNAQAADAPHALPLLDAVRANTRRKPQRVLADAGY